MPVHEITYVYIILSAWSLIVVIVEAIRRNPEKALAFFISFLLFMIGFSSNYQICPMFYCLGVE